MSFPQHRHRRLRGTSAIRKLVAEHRLHPEDFVAPLFVREGIDTPQPITSLPGHSQHTRKSLKTEVAKLRSLGIKAVMLFGLPEHKDPEGSQAWHPDGVVQVALNDLRDDFGDDIVLISDLCLCEYTDHGHCGVLKKYGEIMSGSASGGTHHDDVMNDATTDLYARVAVAQAEAGAHVVAPSGMMDGQVSVIRSALDESGFAHLAILAYSAKFATALYGPFRDAVNVTIAGECGDRSSYQQDMANSREAIKEIHADISEGADMVMVKPALPCLDVIAKAKSQTDVPVAAYQVSGEYAMVHAAAQHGWIDMDAVAYEQVLSIKRAGADIIISYFAGKLCENFAI